MNVRQITVLALAATAFGGVLPAGASTSATEQMDCGYGQVGYADFREDQGPATWKMRGYWQVRNGGKKWGQAVTWTAPNGTHQVHSESGPNHKLLKVEVTSSGRVWTTGVHSCSSADCAIPASPATRHDCPRVPAVPTTPADDAVFVPPILIPGGVSVPGDPPTINCELVCPTVS